MRVHQLVRELLRRHRVTLLCTAGPDERDGTDALGDDLRVRLVDRPESSVAGKRAAQLMSLASYRPYACRAIRSDALQQAIDTLCAEQAFDVIQLETSMLYTLDFPAGPAIVVDEHNVESEVFER